MPAFFPEEIGSWSNLDDLFGTFDQLTHGDCQNLMDFASEEQKQEFKQAIIGSESAHEWARFQIRKQHAVSMLSSLMADIKAET